MSALLDGETPLLPLAFLLVLLWCEKGKSSCLALSGLWPQGNISNRFPLPCGVVKIGQNKGGPPCYCLFYIQKKVPAIKQTVFYFGSG